MSNPVPPDAPYPVNRRLCSPIAMLKALGTVYFYIFTDHLNAPRAAVRPSTNQIVWRWDLAGSAFGEDAVDADADGEKKMESQPKLSSEFMNRVLLLPLVSVLVSCSRADFAIGAPTICVPQLHQIPAGSDNDSRAGFEGCWNRRLPADYRCPLDSQIQTGVIFAGESFEPSVSRRLSDFPLDSVLRLTVEDPSTTVTSIDGRTRVASNPGLDWNWYVWTRPEGVEGEANAITGGDELSVICTRQDAVLIEDRSEREIITCRRHVATHEIAIDYSFISATEVPARLDVLDSSVIKAAESWICSDPERQR